MRTVSDDVLKRGAVFYLLHLILVEIRATESVEVAKSLADIFHRLPSVAANCSTADEYDAAIEDVVLRADRVGYGEHVKALWVLAQKNIAKRHT